MTKGDALKQAACLIGCATYALYRAALRGDVPAGGHDAMKPALGAWVLEVSQFPRCFDPLTGAVDGDACLAAIGRLEAMEREAIEEEPEPEHEGFKLFTAGETIWVLRRLDGKVERWRDATFARIPDEPYFRLFGDHK